MLAVWAGVAFRVVLAAAWPGLPALLDGRVEVTTPVTSFARLREGVFLLAHGIPPYAGDLVYQSPLVLGLFSLLPTSGVLSGAAFAAVDGLTALLLARVARRRGGASYAPDLVAALYLANPFTLMGGLARSTAVFTNCAVAAALAAAAARRGLLAVVLLALATTLAWYPVYLLAPLVLLAAPAARAPGAATAGEDAVKIAWAPVVRLVAAFGAALGVFLGLSYVSVQSWEFVPAVWGTQLLFRDMTRPNLGLWWYFFIEMFEGFRTFFLGVFQLFLAIFPVPLAVRFPRQPLLCLAATLGLHAAFKPYPEVADLGLFISVLALDQRVVELMRFKLVSALGLLYVSALAPTFYNLWIVVGSGNANFFYAITLIYSLTMTLTLTEVVWAAVRLDYDGGKDPRLMQI